MIDRKRIRDFPPISATLHADHSGTFRVGSIAQRIVEADERSAEQALLALMRAEAMQLGRPIRVTVSDPQGTAVLLIGVDGEVEEESYVALSAAEAAELAATPRPAPAIQPVPIAPPAPAATVLAPQLVQEAAQTVIRVRPRRVAVVTLNTGQGFSVANAVVVGRRPEPVAPMDEVFQVRDMTLTLSKTHARFFWEKGELYGVDLGSGNGIVVGGSHRQRAQDPFLIEDGSRLELGDVVATFSILSEINGDRAQATA